MSSVGDAGKTNPISYTEFTDLRALVEKQETGGMHLDNRTAKLAEKLFASIDAGVHPQNASNQVPISQEDMHKLASRLKNTITKNATTWSEFGKVLSAVKDFFISLGNALKGEDRSKQTWGISSLHQLAKHFNKNHLIGLKNLCAKLEKRISLLTDIKTPLKPGQLNTLADTKMHLSNLKALVPIIEEELAKAAKLVKKLDTQKEAPSEEDKEKAKTIAQRLINLVSSGLTYVGSIGIGSKTPTGPSSETPLPSDKTSDNDAAAEDVSL